MIRLHRLPIRLRLVVTFVASLAVLLVLAGAFVFWRVRISLDRRLNQDLRAQSADLVHAAQRRPPRAAFAELRDEAREAQVLDASGGVLASGLGIHPGVHLLSADEARRGTRTRVQLHRGNLFTRHGALRILASPIHGPGGAAVAVMAVRLDQRDEALRELLAQLAIGNGIALLIASALGYRVARAALDPVERYRAQAERITHGATGVRLDVPEVPRDELTRLGDTLNGMIDALERAAERQKEFIDDASHELRTPLTTLAAEISLARRKQRTPEEYEATLARLAASTNELVELAETLLSLGALGTKTAHPEEVQVFELLSAAAERARKQLHDGDRRVVRVVDGDDAVVKGDRLLLERALGNLADNAVRHGHGEIVFAAQTAPDHSHVQLTVHDQGTIDASFLPQAAERFRQGERSRTRAGAGLGLSLAEAIAVAHGGQLRICSAGEHHGETASVPWLRRTPCSHDEAGTTVSLLLPT